MCRHSSENYTSDLLETSSLIPSPSEVNLDRGGCYGTGAGKVGSDEPLLRINSGYMKENSSYLLTLLVKKDRRQALYTQEVVIVPGDPPEVLIRSVNHLGWVVQSRIKDGASFCYCAYILHIFGLRYSSFLRNFLIIERYFCAVYD